VASGTGSGFAAGGARTGAAGGSHRPGSAGSALPQQQQPQPSTPVRGRHPPHGYVPLPHPRTAFAKGELVLASPSTRASTPQSRTQAWLKENWERSKGAGVQAGSASVPAAAHKSQRGRWGAEWVPMEGGRPPSVAAGASQTLIERFNNPNE
jgi:hypothetical protein